MKIYPKFKHKILLYKALIKHYKRTPQAVFEAEFAPLFKEYEKRGLAVQSFILENVLLRPVLIRALLNPALFAGWMDCALMAPSRQTKAPVLLTRTIDIMTTKDKVPVRFASMTPEVSIRTWAVASTFRSASGMRHTGDWDGESRPSVWTQGRWLSASRRPHNSGVRDLDIP